MVFFHTATLRSTIEALEAGENVLVCGARTSGRTTLLKEVGDHYAASGRSPVILNGTRGLSTPLASLRASELGALLPEGQDAAVSSAFAMLVEVLQPGDRSVLIDDIDEFDSVSLGLLDQAIRTTGAAVFATARLGIEAVFGQLTKTFSVATRLDLPSLGFEACGELLRETLGGPVETSTIARLMTKTGGIPGLLATFARSALRADRIVARGGLWQGVSDMWSPGARPAITAVLAELGDDERDALLVLALIGNVEMGVAQNLVDKAVLERLETLGRIGLHGDQSDIERLSISVQPPVLADFLRNESPTLQRLRISSEIESLLGPDFAAVVRIPEMSGYQGSARLEVINRVPDVVFAVLQGRLRADYFRARRDWRSNPVPETALPLLEVLAARGVDRREVLEVLAATRRRNLDARLPLDFVLWEARWLAWVDQDIPRALATIEQAKVDAVAAEQGVLDAFGTHLRLIGADDFRSTPGADIAIPRLGHIPGRDYDQVLREIIAGSPRAGLRELKKLGPVDDRYEKVLTGAFEAEALFLSGGLVEAIELAAERRETAIEQVDSMGICLYSHTLAKALIFMGRFREAEAVLDDALSIGNPGFPHISVHVGNLSMLAVLQGRMGRFDLAIPTQVRAEAFSVPYSYMVLGSPRWSRAYLDALRGERNGEQTLWDVGVELDERGFKAAALGVWGLGMGTWTAAQLDHADAVNADYDGDLFSPMLKYQRALVSGDVEALEAVSATLAAADRPFFAGVALYTASRRIAVDEQPEAIDDRRRRAEEFANLVGVDLFDLTPGASLLSAMSPREREIATMVSRRFSNAEIADRLFLSVRTVESHVHRVLRKLDLTSRADLITLWKKY